VRYRILGPLQVEGGADHPALRRHKPRALLALLLLHANEVVSTDTLLDGIWGESPPPRAIGSLQNNISHLRKVLGEDTLVTRPPGYLLRVEPDELDAALFERLVADAARCAPPEQAERLRSALALWRGPAYANFTFEPFAQNEIRRLEELRLSALEERIAADLALGRHVELVGELETLVAAQPLRERLRGQLMSALYRTSRQADALDVYRDGRRLLREELGLEPSEELRRLERAILEQDANLEAPGATPPPAPPTAPAVRKVVTVLFADVAGHTRLAATLDPEALRNVMRRFFDAMSAVIRRHEGTLEKFSGDDLMAVFGVPVVHEDDALRAVRAATEMRSALAELGDGLQHEHGVQLVMRIGLNSGEVIAGRPGDEPLVTGEAVNVAKRLQQAAAPGEIVLGPVTVSLVRDRVETEAVAPLELRGRPEPLAAARVVALSRDEPGVGRGAAAPLVGRRRELRRLRAAYTHARDKHRPVLAVVLGDAGIGKTRLARELTAGIGDEAEILVGRCVSYGEGATYLPLVDVMRQATHDASIEARVADALDAAEIVRGLEALSGGVALPAAETSWAVRRFLETLAQRRPLVLVLEDLQWAEPTLLDLVEDIAGRTADVPLLVVAIARPDLLERRPQWAEPEGRRVVALEPLDDVDAEALISHLAAEAGLDSTVRGRIAHAAEGNPLFAEQLLAFVVEGGSDALASLPPTVEALLASRLDRLDSSQRSILDRAAVIGHSFRESEVVALSPPEDAGTTGAALTTLVHRSFVRPRRATAATADTFAFRHALIRDAAYAAVPKARRAELHEQFADWLEQRGDAPDEIVGHHLEQAYRFLSELGPVTRHGRQLGTEAGEHLLTAGMAAFKRADVPAATNLLTRVVALLPEKSAKRLAVLSELGLVASLGGDNAGAEAALGKAIELSRQEGDRTAQLRAQLELELLLLHVKRADATPHDVLDLAMSAIPTFDLAGDHRSLGRAWMVVGWVQGGFYCKNALWEDAAQHALEEYRKAGWPVTRCVGELAGALVYGPRPVEEALRRVTVLLDEDIGRGGEANVLGAMASLQAFQGHFGDAGELLGRARAMFEELGFPLVVADTHAKEGMIELLKGDAEAAERAYRTCCEVMERLEQWAHLATMAAELANVLYERGSYDEAEHWAGVARELAGPGDVSAAFSWRSVLAKIRARQGASAAGEELAREAVSLVETTDALNQHANVMLALAEVLRVGGRAPEAARALENAIELFERKGNTVAAASARTLQAELVVV
jgi:class 3 adenylate cyclase/tetratricopeptide (TPR) repeat protein